MPQRGPVQVQDWPDPGCTETEITDDIMMLESVSSSACRKACPALPCPVPSTHVILLFTHALLFSRGKQVELLLHALGNNAMIVSRPAFSGLCQNVAIRYQIQCRSFSVSRFAAINRREQRQRSSKSLQKGMMRSGAAIDEMNEFGLLAENMVWPSRSSRPSFFTYPRLRLRLAGTRIWNFMFDIVGAVYFKFFLKKRPWPRLSLFSISRTAANLHTRMYTALAAGDTRTLQSLCCDSLLRSFSSRIASRPTNEKLRWRLHRYARRGGKPKLVAHKCAKFPSDGLGGATLALRQAVVRIRSVQSLERWREVKGRNGEVRVVREEEGEGEGREITEYLVLQQKFWKGEQGDWMVWGMVEEASVEDILGERVGRVEGKAAG